MAKAIREFLGLDEKGKKKSKPEPKTYYLDDVLEHDPTKICPGCESTRVKPLHTHNVDGIDYQCNACELKYAIIHCNKNEDV